MAPAIRLRHPAIIAERPGYDWIGLLKFDVLDHILNTIWNGFRGLRFL